MSFAKEKDFSKLYSELPPDIQDSLYFSLKICAASLGIIKKKPSEDGDKRDSEKESANAED